MSSETIIRGADGEEIVVRRDREDEGYAVGVVTIGRRLSPSGYEIEEVCLVPTEIPAVIRALAGGDVIVRLSRDDAEHLLSAVGHYRQHTDNAIHAVSVHRSGHPEAREALDGMQAICRSMDAVAAQLLEQEVGGE